jgi:hypothetical protein
LTGKTLVFKKIQSISVSKTPDKEGYKAKSSFNLEVDLLFFDTTSTYFEMV